MSDTGSTAVDAPGGPSEPFDGDRVGRYLLVREIGRGAMGKVLAGFDPDLQRSIAVKVVQEGAHDLNPYLLQEGRVLANLSHPNIVPVFDIGRDGERVFVVMELVDGVSLSAWLDAEPRSPREIIRSWCAAGRGLAAAHEAGVVHRDFKGSNVLVGRDGRVRVADFGLARSPDLDGAPARRYEGTRPYLAPEALATGAITPAVDQFAFCTSLSRALPSPSRRVRAVIERGLAVDPTGRWPSMTALVDALERTQRIPRVVLALGGAGAVGAIVVASLVLTAESSCETPGARIDRVLGKTTLDLAAWSTRYAAACTNPPMRRCLDDRLEDLAGILADAAIDPPDQRVALAQWNAEVAACPTGDQAARGSRAYRHAKARVKLLSGSLRPQDAIAAADQVIALAPDALAKLRARVVRLQLDAPPDLARYEPLFREALALGDPELPGDIAVTAAEACIEQQAPCGALWIARLVDRIDRAPSKDHELKLLGLKGDLAQAAGDDATAAALYGEEVRATTEAFGETWGLFPALIDHADELFLLDRFDEALQVAERADALVVRWVGEDHPFRGNTLWSIANAHAGLHDTAAARAAYERAIVVHGKYAGTDQRVVASILGNLAITYRDDGDFVRALEIEDRAIAIHDRSTMPDDGWHTHVVRTGAQFATMLGQDARPRIDRAFELATKLLAPADPLWPELFMTRSLIRTRARDFAAAEADLQEAIARFQKLPGDRGDRIATAECRRAGLEIRKRALPAARAALDRGNQNATCLIFGIEYAHATKTDAKALVARLLPQFPDDKPDDPRLAAHAIAVAGDPARARKILRERKIPERVLEEDCITCR